MKNLNEYFNFLIKNYDLTDTYNKYLKYLYLFYFSRESFFWIILITQQSELQDKDKLLKIIYLVFSILMISVVFENLYLKYKTKLLVSLNEAHLQYCFALFNKCKENEILKLNFVEQFMYIESIKQGLDSMIQEQKIKTVISVSTITVLLVARRINIFLVGGLLFAFNLMIQKLGNRHILKEEELTEDSINNINMIRNYFVSSKQRIVNNQFNMDYCYKMFKKYINNKMELVNIENDVNTYNSLAVLIITLFVVFYKYKTASVIDIIIYLFIVYDLDHLIDHIFELYKIRKSYGKYNQSLKNLFIGKDKLREQKQMDICKEINNFELISLTNTLPKITLDKSVKFEKGDFILCEGKSGQGKTTFLKFLKNIEKPSEVKIKFCNNEYDDLNVVSEKVYFSIQNNKILYDEPLYDYISNESKEPNIQRIKALLIVVNLEHIFKGDKNEMIEVNKLSGGELARLSLAQTLYDIMEKNCDVILFDEIDVNLDTKTASKIFNNICDIFKEKIIFFIIHNEELKVNFKKRMLFENNIIKANF